MGDSKYGDAELMGRRADQLREQAVDLRALAERLVGQSEVGGWSGRAAEAMRERIHARARALQAAANHHETAAEALTHHLHEVDGLKETIASTERRAAMILADARARISDVENANADRDPGAQVEPDADDVRVAAFTPPPPGHRDWLNVELAGL